MADPVIKRIERDLDDAQRVWDKGGMRVGSGPKVTLYVHDVRRLMDLKEDAGNMLAHLWDSGRLIDMHSRDCPEDDTCDCPIAKQVNRMILRCRKTKANPGDGGG